MNGVEIERKEDEDADDWEYRKESCRTYGNSLTNYIAVRQTEED